MGSPQIHIIHGSRNGRGVEAAASAGLGEPADPVCLVRNEKSLGGSFFPKQCTVRGS